LLAQYFRLFAQATQFPFHFGGEPFSISGIDLRLIRQERVLSLCEAVAHVDSAA